jgi:hypothetical protein
MKIFLFLSLLSCWQNDRSNLLTIIKNHQQNKKGFSVQDAYKLIYQANFGVTHILQNKDHARQYLVQEIENISPVSDEALIENISVSGDIVRINLRPFKNLGNSIETLFKVMERSALEIKMDQHKFVEQWNEFKQAVHQRKLPFDEMALEKFSSEMEKAGYAAVHHSPSYRKFNEPAYRVVKKSIFFEFFPAAKHQKINNK